MKYVAAGSYFLGMYLLGGLPGLGWGCICFAIGYLVT